MASLNEIKKRIKSVQSTSKITNAMKLVATSKLKKQKNFFSNLEFYCSSFYDIFSFIAKNSVGCDFFEQKRNNAEKNICIIFFSNMGLCGNYNFNLIKFLQTRIEEDDEICIIGKKGNSYLKNKNIKNKVILNKEIDDKDFDYDFCKNFSYEFWKIFESDLTFKTIKVFYTKFINSISFEPQVLQLFPLDEKIKNRVLQRPKNLGIFEIESDNTTLLSSIFNDYLATCIYASGLESKVCENASRRNAMDSAAKNADELYKKYELEFNSKRQSNITQEISEVVSGSNMGD